MHHTRRTIATLFALLTLALVTAACEKDETAGAQTSSASAVAKSLIASKQQPAAPGPAAAQPAPAGSATPAAAPATPAPAPKAGVPATAPTGAAPAGWTVFKDAKGEFAVTGPGSPETGSQHVDTEAGKLKFYTFMFKGGSATQMFMIGYSDFPSWLIEDASVKKMLDGGRDGMLRNVAGELKKEWDVTVDGHPGRALEVEAPAPAALGGGMRIRARAYLVKNRLYQVLAIEAKTGKPSKEGQYFIESFKLVK